MHSPHHFWKPHARMAESSTRVAPAGHPKCARAVASFNPQHIVTPPCPALMSYPCLGAAAVDVSGIGSPDWCRPEAEADACLAAPEPRRIQPPARTAHNGTGPPEGRCQGHSITGDRPETPGRLQGGLDLGLILNQLACSPPHPSTPCAVLFFGVSDARWCLSSDAVPDSHVLGHGRGGAALVPGGWRQPVHG